MTDPNSLFKSLLDSDPDLQTFLKTYRIPPPPPDPQLEDRILTAVLSEAATQEIQRPTAPEWFSSWLMGLAVGAAALAALSLQWFEPTYETAAAELVELELFLETTWSETTEEQDPYLFEFLKL